MALITGLMRCKLVVERLARIGRGYRPHDERHQAMGARRKRCFAAVATIVADDAAANISKDLGLFRHRKLRLRKK